VWIPEGQWVEWQTGVRLKGPAEMKRTFSIRQTPVYVRAGAIVPMAPPMQYSSQKPVDPLIVNVLPLDAGQSSSYSLYEDSGDSRAFQRGEFARTEINTSEKSNELIVTVAPAKGSYKGMPTARGYELRLVGGWPPTSVTANGRSLASAPKGGAIGWRYEGNTLTTVITIPPVSVSEQVTVRVTRDAGLVARSGELNGFAGAMTRLREAYDTLNQTWPVAWSPDELIDVMQTGDRLTYHPEKAGEELSHYHQVLPQAIAKVHDLQKGPSEEEGRALAKRLGVEQKSEAAQHVLSQYGDRVARATAALADLPGAAQ
jgi:hypothetical protein